VLRVMGGLVAAHPFTLSVETRLGSVVEFDAEYWVRTELD